MHTEGVDGARMSSQGHRDLEKTPVSTTSSTRTVPAHAAEDILADAIDELGDHRAAQHGR